MVDVDGIDWGAFEAITVRPVCVIGRPCFGVKPQDPESTGRSLIAAAGLGPIESVEHLPDGSVRFRLQKQAKPSNPEGGA